MFSIDINTVFAIVTKERLLNEIAAEKRRVVLGSQDSLVVCMDGTRPR